MRMRTVGVILGGVLVGVLALGLSGVALANAWGPHSMGPYVAASGGTPGTYGPGGMMSGQNPGGMMGSYGPGGMMGGHGQVSAGQGTAVTNVTHATMQHFVFQPANIQVPVGTTVTWTNQDTAPHSVTFRNGMADSGLLQRSQTFSYTFSTPGTFDYYCAVHPYMVARVTVTP